MTERGTTVATITIIEDEGQSFYSLDGGESRVGPFDDEEAAITAANSFLEHAFAEFAKAALFGDK